MTPTGFDRDVWEGRKPTIDSRLGPATIGSIMLATIGNSAWTDKEKRRSAHDESLGGIILDIVDAGRYDDPDTGEIRAKRAFRCYDPVAAWHLAFQTFTDDLIDQAGVEVTPVHSLVWAVRRFCREVGKGKAGLLTSSEAQLVVDAFHLQAALMGGAQHV